MNTAVTISHPTSTSEIESNNYSYSTDKGAVSGYQNFERLRAKADIPVMTGTKGDVVNVLLQRVGQQTLSIKDIASELQLSKRTLQRRLKAEKVSYVELRDLVRFNKAIDCLLVNNMGIQKISKYLAFSDRTSFTNAFRRWTDMTPSNFRKFFRDYV